MEKRTPRTPRAAPANLSIEESVAVRAMTLKDADSGLFSKKLGVLKCELAVEFLEITDMEFGIEGSFKVGARKFCFHCFCY
jgi:hypothetical protein